MLRAHSLLYAIYVCLIVSLLCGALLYMATLYDQLNLHYNSREELYIHNQSLVNYGVANPEESSPLSDSETETIGSEYSVKQYGMLSVIVAKSFLPGDTVSSAHLLCAKSKTDMCLYLTDIDRGLSYSGTVGLIGPKKLPSEFIKPIFIDNKRNHLENAGAMAISGKSLPELSKKVKGIVMGGAKRCMLKDIPKNNEIYSNSFYSNILEVKLEDAVISFSAKGNIMLTSDDSLVVKGNAHLTDIIIKAPKVIIEDGFKGSVQVFATQKITVGADVHLNYPSALNLHNESINPVQITIGQRVKLYGVMVLHGNQIMDIDKNTVSISEECAIVCDIYCSGRLITKSDIYGTVYTNRIVHKTASTGYDNCIADISINPEKRPSNFYAFELINDTKGYVAIKKVI